MLFVLSGVRNNKRGYVGEDDGCTQFVEEEENGNVQEGELFVWQSVVARSEAIGKLSVIVLSVCCD